MYILYIANKNYSSWSLRPWVLMRSLGIQFEERLVNFDQEDNHEKFRSFSPNGKVPCLHDGNQIVWDSLGITEFLADRHPLVWPEQAEAKVWARCVAAEMHSGFTNLRGNCPMHVGYRIKIDAIPEAVKHDLQRIQEIWNEGLQRFGGPYLAGTNFTAVDAFFAPVIFRIQTYQLPVDAGAQAYVQQMLKHEAMQQWQTQALADPWREASHDQAPLHAGSLQSDERLKK